MNLVKYKGLPSFFQEMDQFFAESWNPKVDITETENEITLKAECPGMKQEDLDIAVKGNILTIKGEKKTEKEDKNSNFHLVERQFGTFTRSFTLPNSVDADSITGDYSDGILQLVMTKKEGEKERKINLTKSMKATA